MRGIATRVLLVVLLVDHLFKVLVAVALMRLLSVSEPWLWRSYGLFGLVDLPILLAFALLTYRALRPVDAGRGSEEPEVLRPALRACWRAPSRVAAAAAVHWLLLVPTAYLVIEQRYPDVSPTVAAGRVSVALMTLTVVCGAGALVYSLVDYLVGPVAAELSLALTAQRRRVAPTEVRLAQRLGMIALALVLAPTFWMASLATMIQVGVRANDQSFAWTIGVFAITAGLFALMTAWLFSRSVARPMVAMAEVVNQISDHCEDGHRVAVPPILELGRLAAGLNTMIGRLEYARADRAAVARLERDVAQVRETNRAKSEFLANMSHEIRTPLTAVQGYADLLLEPDLPQPDRLAYVQSIHRNSEHLLRIIDDILDLSRIEAQRLVVERVFCSPAAILGEIASLMRARAQDKGLGFGVVYLTPVPVTIETDPARLRQILLNLVGNAVKFTERGSVQVFVSLDEEGDHPTLKVEVVDTGVGIASAHLARLFEPFTQVDGSVTRRFGGTGLGLVICQRLASLLGGQIHLDSAPGRGTTATLTLDTGPVEGVARVTDQALTSTPAPRRLMLVQDAVSVLVADDGRDNRLLIATQLRKAGFEVEAVDNGERAVERALAAAAMGHPFDVVLMDMQMPVLDGYQATARLRAVGYVRPILALTAHAAEGDRERCLSAGCTAYMAKPADRVALVELVSALARDGHTEGALQSRVPALRSELAEDPDLAELLGEFVAGLSDRAAELRAAVVQKNREVLARCAHQMRGAAGGYGFPSITEAAARVELAAQRGDTWDRLIPAVEHLARLCVRAQAA